jgi:zinc transport system substrate-binding protein
MRIRFLPAALAMTFAAPAMAEVPGVITDTPVVHALVAGVMAGLGTPVLLLDRGADAHDFQLRPSQVRALNDAALVVWTGPAMTPWLDGALGAMPDRERLTLLDQPGTRLRQYAEEGGGDHADDTAEEHGHAHEGTDPHAWLDPTNAALWLGQIAETLAALDPANAETYRANAAATREAVEALDASLAARLEPVKGKGLIMAHAAYGYFADRYGLTIAGSLAEGDASAPGAAHVAALRDLAMTGAVACAFAEAGHDPRAVTQLVAGTPARLGRSLDPAGASGEPGAGLYAAVLEGIGDAIADCVARD